MPSPFGWNYPPGVTGNEPEISGYPECDLNCHCGVCHDEICDKSCFRPIEDCKDPCPPSRRTRSLAEMRNPNGEVT